MRKKALILLTATALLLAGCGTFRETFPPRSATEQLLLSTAVDEALEHLPTYWMRGVRVYLDDSRLDAYDKPYLLQRLRDTVLAHGGRLTDERGQADVVLEVASGALSVDKGSWLLGIPELPLPIPFAGETLKLPELPLFRLDSYAGKAKLLLTAVDPEDGTRYTQLPLLLGRVQHRHWWLLLAGPFTWSDLEKELR